MFGLAQFGRGAINLGARVEQLIGFQQVAALIALVAAGIFVAADVAGAFHVAVRQKAALAGGVPLHLAFGVKETILLERQEHLLRHLLVIAGVGAGEEVVGQPQLLEEVNEAGVEALVDLVRGGLFGIRADGDGRAVRVGPGDHQHLASAHALIARKDIRRQVRAGQIAHMDFGIGIRPGNSHKDGSPS